MSLAGVGGWGIRGGSWKGGGKKKKGRREGAMVTFFLDFQEKRGKNKKDKTQGGDIL